MPQSGRTPTHMKWLAGLLAVTCLDRANAATETPPERYQLLTALDEIALFADTQSIVRDGEQVWVWTLLVQVTEEENDPDMIRLRQVVDCNRRTIRSEIALAFREGVQIDELSPSDRSTVIPNTPGERIFNYACRGQVIPDAATIPLFSESRVEELKSVMQADANAARD